MTTLSHRKLRELRNTSRYRRLSGPEKMRHSEMHGTGNGKQGRRSRNIHRYEHKTEKSSIFPMVGQRGTLDV